MILLVSLNQFVKSHRDILSEKLRLILNPIRVKIGKRLLVFTSRLLQFLKREEHGGYGESFSVWIHVKINQLIRHFSYLFMINILRIKFTDCSTYISFVQCRRIIKDGHADNLQ